MKNESTKISERATVEESAIKGERAIETESTRDTERAAYLGDGLYVEFDGFQFRLYASNGIEVTNEVFLEPSVLKAFVEFVKQRGVRL